MVSCEEQVITACGLQLFSEEGELANENTGFITCFEQKKSEENFIFCLEIWKITARKVSNILKWVFRNLKTLKGCCPQKIKKKNVYIWGEKKRCKVTVETQLYLCANQLHVSAIYSHNKAEHIAGLHTDDIVFRLRACIFSFLLTLCIIRTKRGCFA